jgi:hypothetical protein
MRSRRSNTGALRDAEFDSSAGHGSLLIHQLFSMTIRFPMHG